MDGISNVQGEREITMTVDGKVYRLRPKTLDHYTERENYILSRKPDPLKLLEALPPLPDAPVVPIGPGPGCSAEDRRKFGETFGEYAKRKAEHDGKIAARLRLEEGLRKEAMLPRFVSFADDAAFDRSLHGMAYHLWCALRDHHPEISSVPEAMRLMERMGSARFGEVESKLGQSDEKDLLKNSNGSATGPVEQPVVLPGATSSADSPNATAGTQASSAN